MTWFQTFLGGRFDYESFGPKDVRIADVAHALAIENRFMGHTVVPYSVADHSVHVSRLVEPKHAFAALTHDFAEAFVKDVPSPLKQYLAKRGDRALADLEEFVHVAVRRQFGVRWDAETRAAVKRADLVALATERRDLLMKKVPGWEWLPDPDPEPLFVSRDWAAAEARLMNRFWEVKNAEGDFE